MIHPDLKPPRVDLDDPGELAQSQDLPVGQIADADLNKIMIMGTAIS